MLTTLNRTLGVSAATAVALGLACCARQPEQAQHTVAEYRANADLRREQFARCTNDPGTLGKTPDCVNAREAQRLEDIGSVRDAPPIQLPQPESKK
jgi:hypothetical protein